MRACWRALLVATLTALVSGCGGGGGGTGPSENIRFLFEHNARFNNGRTVRWPNLPIRVFAHNIARQSEVLEWTGATGGVVTFVFVGSRGGADITFDFGTQGPDVCGLTVVEFLADGTIVAARVEVVRDFRGPQCVKTITHEVGHAIGFLDHTTDGGLMDDDGGDGRITPPVARMMVDLYSMPPGTFLGIPERARVVPERRAGRYTMTFVYPARR